MFASSLIDDRTLESLNIGEDYNRMIEDVTILLEEQFWNLVAAIHRWKSWFGSALAVIVKTLAFLEMCIEDSPVTVYCIQASVANIVLPTTAITKRLQTHESIERFDPEIMAFEEQ